MVMRKDNFLCEAAEQAILEAAMEPEEQAAETLLRAIQDLEVYGDTTTNSRICTALGTCWYHFPRRNEQRDVETERWLLRALELEPGNRCARLYLGYFLYDCRRYEEAREQLRQLPAGACPSCRQMWCDIKRRELLLCCDIFTSGGVVNVEELRAVCARYLAVPTEALPVPVELVRALSWAVSVPEQAALPREAFGECARMIDLLGLRDAFRSELQECQSRLGAAA